MASFRVRSAESPSRVTSCSEAAKGAKKVRDWVLSELAAAEERTGMPKDQEVVIHASPKHNESKTPCCGLTPFELPAYDRISLEYQSVNCSGKNRSVVGGMKSRW